MLPLFLVACSGGPTATTTEGSPAADTAATGGTGELPLEKRFAFVVFADPHIASNPEHEVRLAAAVDWVNGVAVERQVDFVAVVGDVGWGAGLPVAKALLDELDVPYLPVLGDNEIATGHEQGFADTFAPQYELLASTFAGFSRGPVEVENPVHEQTSWFQNFAFDHEGMRFVGLDWCSRNDDNVVLSEVAELHDFDGGTLPWFQDELATLDLGPDENVVLFSHHPMEQMPGGFLVEDWPAVVEATSPVGHRIAAGFAGHLHLDLDVPDTDGGYDVFVTDATWDDENTVRVVEVWGNGERFQLRQELVVVPF